MADFVLQHIHPASENDFATGTYIVVFNAQQVPPHLLISHEGKIYSVSVSGRQLGSPLAKLETFIERKTVPTLFIEWKLPEHLSADEFETLLKKAFALYPRLEAGKNSCLSPIRDLADMLYGGEMKKARFIFELLPLLRNENATGKTFYSHIAVSENTFTLQTYTETELENAIRNAERSATVSD